MMPKMKTRRGAAKRVRISKTGKVRVKKAKLRHILTTKSKKSKRHMRKGTYVARADHEKIFKMMPYAGRG
jgi:large subunit ribosomal protein L35